MDKKAFQIGVLGAGAWGQALATAAMRAGTPTLLWGRRNPFLDARYPIASLPKSEQAYFEPDLKCATAVPVLLLAIPCQALRGFLQSLKPYLAAQTRLVNCAKGIEQNSLAFPSEIIEKELNAAPQAVLSGPSFASEVIKNKPTLVTLAAHDEVNIKDIATMLWSSKFRPYTSDDVRGVEIGGAAKNVLAIACGVAAGLNAGDNAKSALISRAFAEISRFGEAEGSKTSTLTGLSGLGDLILTCSGPESRNFLLGQTIAKAGSINNTNLNKLPLSEGYKTAPALLERAHKKGVSMPITESVVALLNGQASPSEIAKHLLERPLTSE